MASAARPSTSRSFYGVIEVAFISIRCRIQEHRRTSRHAVLVFLLPLLLNFVELQYQGKVVSPFETHPKTMRVAIASLLLYGMAYDAELKFSSSHHRKPCYALVIRGGMVVFGSLSAVSLASVLLQDSVGPVLYLLCFLFSASELLLHCSNSSRFQMLWNWLRQRMRVIYLPREPEMPERP